MDFEGALTFFETKARAYVLHILGFLGSTGQPDAAAPADAAAGDAAPESAAPGTIDQEALAFGLISLAIGVTLQGIYISHQHPDKIPFVERFITEGCFWLLLSVVAHLALNLGKHVAAYSVTMVATIAVLPTAFMLGAYATFVAANLLEFLGLRATAAPGLFDIVVQMLVITRYFPRALHLSGHRAKVALVTWLLAGSVVLVDLIAQYQLTAPVLADLLNLH